jgi:predicted RNase H-like HicB family nuclease
MPDTSIVDDYLLSAMLRARGSRAENGTVVLTVPEFRGIVACGADPRQAFDELYRLLEDWVRVSFEKDHQLPVLTTEGGIFDLNRAAVRALAKSSKGVSTVPSEGDRTYLGGPEEFEAFLERVGSSDSVTDR